MFKVTYLSRIIYLPNLYLRERYWNVGVCAAITHTSMSLSRDCGIDYSTIMIKQRLHQYIAVNSIREMANNAMGWANARNPPIACKILDTHILRDVCRVCVRCSEMKLLPLHCAMFHRMLQYGHCRSCNAACVIKWRMSHGIALHCNSPQCQLNLLRHSHRIAWQTSRSMNEWMMELKFTGCFTRM